MDGKSAVGCATSIVLPVSASLLQSRIAVSTQAHLPPTTSAQGCQHLGSQQCLSNVDAFSPDPIIIHTSKDWDLKLFVS